MPRFSLRTLIVAMLLGGLTIGLAGRFLVDGYRALQRTLEMTYEAEHRQQRDRLAEQLNELAQERWQRAKAVGTAENVHGNP